MSRLRILHATAALALITAAAAAGGTPRKPFTPTARFCATYVSPAFVKSVTGFDATPQKGPAGQCHFVVGGQKDAFQIVVWNLGTPAKAKAMLKQGWSVVSQDAAGCQAVDPNSPPPAGYPCGTPQRLSGYGDAGFVYDKGPAGFTWFDFVRGPQYFAIQAFATNAYVTTARAEAIAKKLLGRVPKYAGAKTR